MLSKVRLKSHVVLVRDLGSMKIMSDLSQLSLKKFEFIDHFIE